jgi:hypothetical protein
MGLTRKLVSISSGGIVDYRSDKERAAPNTAKTARQAKKANALLKQQIEDERRAAALEAELLAAQNRLLGASATTRASEESDDQTPRNATGVFIPPAGWYADPQKEVRLRWWDGDGWTDSTSSYPHVSHCP